jgi:hypothetical protein
VEVVLHIFIEESIYHSNGVYLLSGFEKGLREKSAEFEATKACKYVILK